MVKFDRNYLLRIGLGTDVGIQIEPPFTIEFDIQRNQTNSSNTASFRIYNLSERRRSQLRKDPYSTSVLRPITFLAGYGKNLSLAFAGNLSQGSSVRQNVDFITTLECFGGSLAFTQSLTNQSFPKNSTIVSILTFMLGDLKSQANIDIGAIGSFQGSITRGNSVSGSTTDLLKEKTNGGFFIDNGKAYCLNDDECIQGPVRTITSSFGILGTPTRDFSSINFTMLFEPRLMVGQLVDLELDSFIDQNSSTVNPVTGRINGSYKIVEIKHKGIISPTVCGAATTTVKLFSGNKKLVVV